MELTPEIAARIADCLKDRGREWFIRSWLITYRDEPNYRTEAIAKAGIQVMSEARLRQIRKLCNV